MANKTYKFRGLDLRSNPLEREDNTARDCSNVRLNGTNILEKIEQFTGLNLPYETTDDYVNWDDELPTGSSIFDIVEFNGKFILFVKVPPITSVAQTFAVSLYEYDIDLDALTVIVNNNGNVDLSETGWSNWESVAFDGKMSTFEKNGVLYFQSASNSETGDGIGTPLMGKYDGLVWHAAGVDPILFNLFPNGVDEGTLAGNFYYVREVPIQIDNQGNQTFGQWRVSKVDDGGGNISGFRQRTSPDTKNYNTAAFYTSIVPQNLTQVSLSLFAGGINCVAGQVMLYYNKPTKEVFQFTIDTIIGATVTLKDPKLLTENSVWVTATSFNIALPAFAAFSNTLLAAYFSREYSFGYVYGDVGISHDNGAGPLVIDFNAGAPNTVPTWSLFSTRFEDFYGTEIKGNPPPGIQVREYGDGAIIIDSNTLYYSDLSINGTVENFTGFENFSVGEEETGDIVSFFSNETFIAVFRERESYLVSGNIYTGNYRVLSYRSTGVGGASPSGVIEVKGQGLFMSNRGPAIALENGSMSEIGDRIEPLFVDDALGLNPDLSSAKVSLDEKRELIYMFIESLDGASKDFTIVYDYRNSEWFKYDNMSMRGGVVVRKTTGKTYYCDGTDLYVEADAYTTGVSAYWTSNFGTLGVAALKKRYQRLHLFLTTKVSGKIGFKSFRDWDASNPYTDETITPSPTIPMDSRRLNPKTVYSNSFHLSSTGSNKMEIDGFEYSYELEQESLNDDNRG